MHTRSNYPQVWTVVPGDRCCLKRFSGQIRPHANHLITGMKDPSLCANGNNVASMTDSGPDVGWLTAGYLSGGLGLGTVEDRLLNIGWVTGMSFDPLHMRRGGDKSGGLTVPREINYDPRLRTLVANPVRELVNLCNGTLTTEEHVQLSAGSPYALPGTGGGEAASADIDITVSLPAEAVVVGVVVLSNKGYVPPGEGATNHGVQITATLTTPQSDGSRTGLVNISSHNAAACVPGSKFPCEDYRTAQSPLTLLPGETTLRMRVLVDRVVVEAFVQGGRVQFTKSYIPPTINDSVVHVFSSVDTSAPSVSAWSMGCGWVGVDEEYRG